MKKYPAKKKIFKALVSFVMALSIAMPTSIVSLADTDTALTGLSQAISRYESAMGSGTVYTNMSAAYEAYVNAQKAYDAYYYGGDTGINISQYTNALTSATSKMGIFSKKTASQIPLFSSNETAYSSNATNCLWYETNYDPLAYSWTGGNNSVYNVYFHKGVYMYDGTLPKIPFIIGIYRYSRTGNPANPRIFYASLDSSNGGLSIANPYYNGDVADRWFNTLMNKGYHISSSSSSSTSIILSSGDVRYMANQFTPNASSIVASADYYITAYPNTINYGVGYKNSDSIQKTETQWLGGLKPFYIINYKAVLDNINSTTYSGYLKNIKSYTQGGLSELMKSYDAATSFDPSSYGYSSNTETAVQYCGNAIKTICSNFNALGTPSADNSGYVGIRNAIQAVKTSHSSNPTISSGTTTTTRYTVDSYNNLNSNLGEAMGAMRDVLSNGYTGTYNSKSIGTISSNVTKAVSDLKKNYIVQFYSSSNSLLGEKVYADGEYTDVSLYPNTPAKKGTNTKRVHTIYKWESKQISSTEYGDAQTVSIKEAQVTGDCSLSVTVQTKTPTCTENGLNEMSCVICNAKYSDIVLTAGHSYTTSIIPATCSTPGYIHYTCSVCGVTYDTEFTKPLPHNYETITVAPTCDKDGYTGGKCIDCGYETIYEDSYVEKLGHSYTTQRVMIADCICGDMIEYTCTVCKESYTEETEINPLVHSSLVYARTVAPTEDQMGYDIYYCSYLCGYWEKRSITPPTSLEALDSSYNDYLETYNQAYKYIVTDFNPYTRESISQYWSEIARAREIAENAIENGNPSGIDQATRIIIESKTMLAIE